MANGWLVPWVMILAAAGSTRPDPVMVVGDQIARAGGSRQLTHDAEVYSLAASPDGKWIAYLELSYPVADSRTGATVRMMGPRVSVIPASGGMPRVLLKAEMMFAGGLNPDLCWCQGAPILVVPWLNENGEVREVRVFDARTWQSQTHTLGGARLQTVACEPQGTRILIGTMRSPDTPSQVLLADARTGAVTVVGEGIIPRWNAEGDGIEFLASQRVVDADGSERRQGKLVNYDLEAGQSVLLERDMVVGITRWPIRLQSPSGRFRVELAHDQAADTVFRSVIDLHSGESQVVTRDSGPILGWSAKHDLLLFGSSIPLRDEVRNEWKGNLFLLWALNPERRSHNTLLVAADASFEAEWAGDSLSVCFVRGGQIWLADLRLDDATLDERAHYGLPLSDEQKLQLAESRMREVSAALQNVLKVWGSRFPDLNAESFPEGILGMVGSLLPNSDSLGAPGGEALVSFLIQPGQMVMGRPNPQGVPLAFLAWPRGYVFAAMLDGSVRRFTDAEWDVFSADAKAAGNWPPDWND